MSKQQELVCTDAILTFGTFGSLGCNLARFFPRSYQLVHYCQFGTNHSGVEEQTEKLFFRDFLSSRNFVESLIQRPVDGIARCFTLASKMLTFYPGLVLETTWIAIFQKYIVLMATKIYRIACFKNEIPKKPSKTS